MTSSSVRSTTDLSELAVGDFLEQLSGRTAAPGGGAAAGIQAAQAAALLAMAGRFSDQPQRSADAEHINFTVTEADNHRARCLTLAQADAVAFTAVAQAYTLPKHTDTERQQRRHRIGRELVRASEIPCELIRRCAALVALAEQLVPIANRNLLADVAAAAAAARSAAVSARLNLEINLRGIHDTNERKAFAAALDEVEDVCRRADVVDNLVRASIAS